MVAQGGAALTGFAIAGATGNWVWGNATISGDTVIVSSASVPAPTRVRYAWADNPIFNLFNAAGLPASPFTTESPSVVAVMEMPKQVPARRPVNTLAQHGGFWVNALGQRINIQKVHGSQIIWQQMGHQGFMALQNGAQLQRESGWTDMK